MNEVTVELGCDWHTVNDAVIAYGTVLVDPGKDRPAHPWGWTRRCSVARARGDGGWGRPSG